MAQELAQTVSSDIVDLFIDDLYNKRLDIYKEKRDKLENKIAKLQHQLEMYPSIIKYFQAYYSKIMTVEKGKWECEYLKNKFEKEKEIAALKRNVTEAKIKMKEAKQKWNDIQMASFAILDKETYLNTRRDFIKVCLRESFLINFVKTDENGKKMINSQEVLKTMIEQILCFFGMCSSCSN